MTPANPRVGPGGCSRRSIAGGCALLPQYALLRLHGSQGQLELLSQRPQTLHRVAGPDLSRNGGDARTLDLVDHGKGAGISITAGLRVTARKNGAERVTVMPAAHTREEIRTVQVRLSTGQQRHGQVLVPEHLLPPYELNLQGSLSKSGMQDSSGRSRSAISSATPISPL